LPPFEKTRNGRREQKHRTSLSDHASKVATLPFMLRMRLSLDCGYAAVATQGGV
jgi:hypothetical protein